MQLIKVSFTLLICGVAIWQVKNYFSSKEIIIIITESFARRPYLIFLMLSMSFLNWSFEAFKWITVLPKKNKIFFFQALKSVLIGLGMSLLIPRLAGETIGRYTSHKGNKQDVVSALVLTKVFQAIVTLSFGFIGIIYFKSQFVHLLHLPHQSLLFLFVLGSFIVVFYRKKITNFIRTNSYFESFREMNVLKGMQLAVLSVVRYLSFFGQCYTMCLFINIQLNIIDLFFSLATVYLVRMATISINVVVDLGVRFATALFVISTLGVIPEPNAVIVIFSLVWLFNVILPSLVGGILILKNQ